jgi:uncharacterized protein
MHIRQLSRDECLDHLTESRLMRLACARDNQPYVLPVYLVYHEMQSGQAYLYGFTTDGQKVEWMRANPLVCVEADRVTANDQWVSVVALGRFEEMRHASEPVNSESVGPPRSFLASESPPKPAQPLFDDEIDAWQIIKSLPEWYEPGYTSWASRLQSGSKKEFVPVFYRISIESVTGQEATQDEEAATTDDMGSQLGSGSSPRSPVNHPK